jgi:hypothetical protein
MLVTLPEETPVNEVVETAFKLEDQVGVHLTPVVVNGMYPRLDLTADVAEAAATAGVALTADETASIGRAATFRMHRQDLQAEQTRRLAAALPLTQLHLPFLFTTELGTTEVDALARALVVELAKLPDVVPGTVPGRKVTALYPKWASPPAAGRPAPASDSAAQSASESESDSDSESNSESEAGP